MTYDFHFALHLVLVNLSSQVGESLSNVDLANLINVVVRLNFSVCAVKVLQLWRNHADQVLDCFAFPADDAIVFLVQARGFPFFFAG